MIPDDDPGRATARKAGIAFEAGWLPRPEGDNGDGPLPALFRLVVDGAELPGRFRLVGRRFVPA